MPDELENNFERIIADAFVQDINKSNKLCYKFVCRPDEKNPGFPDFKYHDDNEHKSLFIEFKRTLGFNLEEYHKTREIYNKLQDKLKGKLDGSYIISIDSERDKISQLPRGKERDVAIYMLAKKIIEYCEDIAVGAKIDIAEEIFLIKIPKDNKFLHIIPTASFYNKQQEEHHLLKGIVNAKRKFDLITDSPSQNILVILNTYSIATEINVFIMSPYDTIKSDEITVGKPLDIGKINEIYEIELNTDWDKSPFGLSKCHPEYWTKNWLNHSEIFNNQMKYRNAFYHYFHGSKQK